MGILSTQKKNAGYILWPIMAHLFLLGPAAGGLCQGIRRRALRTGLGKGPECTKLIMSTDE